MVDKKKNTNDQSAQDNTDVTALQEEITALTKKLAESEEIAKRAQSDYVRYKMDMDAYMIRAEADKSGAETQALTKIAQKLLPVVTQLEQTVSHIPEDLTDHARVESVRLSYAKALQELDNLSIQLIKPQSGDDPDFGLHVPISSQPVEDESMSGKIVSCIESGYLYTGVEPHVPLVPAKVVVGVA